MTKSVTARRRQDTLGIDERFLGVGSLVSVSAEGRKEERKERQKEGRVEQSADQFGF